MSESMTMPEVSARISSLLRQALRAKLREFLFQYQREKNMFNQVGIQWAARCCVYDEMNASCISAEQAVALITWIHGWHK